MNDLISIIIPVYNVEQYIRRCVDSILNQTYKNIEVILVDDGSTDNSGVICEEYKKKDLRVKVIDQKNSGAPTARNCGMDASTGKYIYFVDSDDYIHPQTLEILYNIITQKDTDVSACGYEIVYDNKLEFEEITDYESRVISNFDLLKKMVNLPEMTYSQVLWNKLFKREAIGDIRMNPGYVIDDFDFVSRVLFKCRSVAVVDKDLYYYYTNPNGVMNSRKYNPKKFLALQAWYDMAATYKKLGDEEMYYKCMKRSLATVRASIAACCDGRVCDKEWILYLKQQIEEKKSEIFLVSRIVDKVQLMLFYRQYNLFKLVFNILNPLRMKLKNRIG